MRIAHVITSYHPIVGGAEKQVAQLARRMIGRGHDVRIVTRHHPGLARAEIIDGTPVFRAAAPGPKPFAAAAFLAGAVAHLRALKPDVIHCHSLWSPALAGSLARLTLDAALLAKPMRGGEAERIAGKPFGRMRLARLGRAVDAFPAVSQEIVDELTDLGMAPGKIRFIPNGVDTDRFAPPSAAERRAVRAELGLPETGALVIYAGRLSPQKRLDTLIAAWGAFTASGAAPDARLMVAEAERIGVSDDGYAQLSAALDRTPQIIRLGHVSDMPAALRAADVFVLPSGSEGLSNALLEACASGLACLATDIGGSRDLIAPGVNGALFPTGDAAALQAGLAALIADPDLRARYGAAARAKVEDGYGIGRTADTLLELYAEIGARRGRARDGGLAMGAAQ